MALECVEDDGALGAASSTGALGVAQGVLAGAAGVIEDLLSTGASVPPVGGAVVLCAGRVCEHGARTCAQSRDADVQGAFGGGLRTSCADHDMIEPARKESASSRS